MNTLNPMEARNKTITTVCMKLLSFWNLTKSKQPDLLITEINLKVNATLSSQNVITSFYLNNWIILLQKKSKFLRQFIFMKSVCNVITTKNFLSNSVWNMLRRHFRNELRTATHFNYSSSVFKIKAELNHQYMSI